MGKKGKHKKRQKESKWRDPMMLDYDDLIRRAKKRLEEQGQEVTSLAVYHLVPLIKKEDIRRRIHDRQAERHIPAPPRDPDPIESDGIINFHGSRDGSPEDVL
jgi:hypothetical protein